MNSSKSMISFITMLMGILLFSNCNSRPGNNISSGGDGNDNIILLAPADEPGERLIVNVAVSDKQTGAPISDS